MAFVSQIEPYKIDEALEDGQWILPIQEELNQFEKNQVWELVPRISGKHIIGTKWVFKNKLDENDIIVQNKARLVYLGYNQEEETTLKKHFPHYKDISYSFITCLCLFIKFSLIPNGRQKRLLEWIYQ